MSRWSPFGVPPTSKINNIYIFVDYIGIEVESILEYFQNQIVNQKHNSDKITTKQTRIEFTLASKWSPITEYFQHHIANANITETIIIKNKTK